MTVETRLKPARAITHAGVPCLVWAEDALSFAHFVPTEMFALQLLIPDKDIERAAQAITSGLPYRRLTEPHKDWLDFEFMDPDQWSCFPNSIRLELTLPQSSRHEDDPVDIYIHPASWFYFDVKDDSRSVSLVPPLAPANSALRFPTRTAFLDSLISNILDPPTGVRHGKLDARLFTYISYINLYTLRAFPRVLPNGDLEPEHAAVSASLKPENRRLWESNIRNTYKGWIDEVTARRAILESMGRVAEARKPFPKDRCFTWKKGSQARGLHTSTLVGSSASSSKALLVRNPMPTPPNAAISRAFTRAQNILRKRG